MKNKVCPICKNEKPLEEYHKYFSKERQKYRLANYCKSCSREVSKKNATKNYYENKPKKLEYAKKYREENKERIKAKRPYYKKKQIEECQNCYVRELLVSKNKIEKGLISENPEILETKRLSLKIKRKLKELKKKKPIMQKNNRL